MDDSQMYTGVDGEPTEGMFGNEVQDDKLKDTIREQEAKITKLMPVAETVLEAIDAEIELSSSIDRFITATAMKDENIRAELQATALYNRKLRELKTTIVLAIDKQKK